MLKHEFVKAIQNKLLFVCIGIGILSGLGGLFSYSLSAKRMIRMGEPQYISCFQAWLHCLSIGEGTVYRVIAPLLIIPNLDSLFREKKSGYSAFVVTRANYVKYYFSKLFSGAVISGLVLIVILFSWFVVCLAMFPCNPPLDWMTYIPDQALRDAFVNHPVAYILGIAALNFLFAFASFSIGYGLSAFCSNRYGIMILPFLIYLSLTMIASMVGSAMLSPVALLVPHEIIGISYPEIFIKLLVMLGVAVLCVLCGFRRCCHEVF